MPAIHLPAAGHRAVPWKNGLGTSYTIADFPRGAGFDTVDWQVSATRIGADCPFSDLPGLDRLFTVIGGAGAELTSVDEHGKASVRRVDPASGAFAFRGDWRTACRLLDGPVQVFNVMTRRGRYAARVEPVSGLQALRRGAGETAIAVELPSLEAWILDGPPPAFGRGLLVIIR